MGVFNKAIPVYKLQNGNLQYTQVPEEVYLDDVFDPFFNLKARDYLTNKYNLGGLGNTLSGMAEVVDNAILGQNDKWGILGPGMGILSTFGRSMDKAGDFILGGATELVNLGNKVNPLSTGANPVQNPFTNIFELDQDYTGQRLLASMANSMNRLAGGVAMQPEDFGKAWNLPSLGIELATDPGIMGGSMVKHFTPALSETLAKQSSKQILSQLGNQKISTSLGQVGQLLSNYDDIMARASWDLTVPGARQLLKKYMGNVHSILGNEVAINYKDVEVPTKDFSYTSDDAFKGSSFTSKSFDVNTDNLPSPKSKYSSMIKQPETPDNAWVVWTLSKQLREVMKKVKLDKNVDPALYKEIANIRKEVEAIKTKYPMSELKEGVYLRDRTHIGLDKAYEKAKEEIKSKLTRITEQMHNYTQLEGVSSELQQTMKYIDASRYIDESVLDNIFRYDVYTDYKSVPNDLKPSVVEKDTALYVPHIDNATFHDFLYNDLYNYDGGSKNFLNKSIVKEKVRDTLDGIQLATFDEAENVDIDALVIQKLISGDLDFGDENINSAIYKKFEKLTGVNNYKSAQVKAFISPSSWVGRNETIADAVTEVFREFAIKNIPHFEDTDFQGIDRFIDQFFKDNLLDEYIKTHPAAQKAVAANKDFELHKLYNYLTANPDMKQSLDWSLRGIYEPRGKTNLEFMDRVRNFVDKMRKIDADSINYPGLSTDPAFLELMDLVDFLDKEVLAELDLKQKGSFPNEILDTLNPLSADLNPMLKYMKFTKNIDGVEYADLAKLDDLVLSFPDLDIQIMNNVTHKAFDPSENITRLMKDYYAMRLKAAKKGTHITRAKVEKLFKKHGFSLNMTDFKTKLELPDSIYQMLKYGNTQTEIFENFLRNNPTKIKKIDKQITNLDTKIAKNSETLDFMKQIFIKDKDILYKSSLEDYTTYSKEIESLTNLIKDLGNQRSNLFKQKQLLQFQIDNANANVDKIIEQISQGKISGNAIKKYFVKQNIPGEGVPGYGYLERSAIPKITANTGIDNLILESGIRMDKGDAYKVADLMKQAISKLEDSELIWQVAKTTPDYAMYKNQAVLELLAIPDDLVKTINMVDITGNPKYWDEIEDYIKTTMPNEKYTLFKLIKSSSAEEPSIAEGKRATLLTDTAKSLIDESNHLTNLYKANPKKVQECLYVRDAAFGDVLIGQNMLTDLRDAGGKHFTIVNNKQLPELEKVINYNVSVVNQAGDILKVYKRQVTNDTWSIGYAWNLDNKRIMKDIKKVKTDNLKNIVFQAPNPNAKNLLNTDPDYVKINSYLNKLSQRTSDMGAELGFDFSQDYLKHSLIGSEDTAFFLRQSVYGDELDIDGLDQLSMQMTYLHPEDLKQFNIANQTRSLRGGIYRYNKNHKVFSEDLTEITKSALSEGVFANRQYQTFTGLFTSGNYNLSNFDLDVDKLKNILFAKDANGKLTGNAYNLTLCAPIYNGSGMVTGFKRFDKFSQQGLEDALKNPNTILVPTNAMAHLDRLARKRKKMSNKVYAFINKYITIPIKYGILANPGFLVGNMTDAYYKQAVTEARKNGTTVAHELGNVARAYTMHIKLNNAFSDVYDKYIGEMSLTKTPLTAYEKIIDNVSLDYNVRKKFLDWTSKDGAPLITDTDRRIIDTWIWLNKYQPSTYSIATAEDLLKQDYEVPSNILERILTGSGKYDVKKFDTWGLFTNNPYSQWIMDKSGRIEADMRSTAILNDLMHTYNVKSFEDLIGINTAGEGVDMLDINMQNAINTMFASNYNYDNVTNLMDAAGTVIPFPTFFLKNTGYWLEVALENPEMINHAIRIQENAWRGRDTSKDEFSAESKGRGAVPTNLPGVFKGLWKNSPLNSMFGAFNTLNDPLPNMAYRLHPGLAPLTRHLQDDEDVRYRPYSTNPYERNVKEGDPNFSKLKYTFHRLNPYERTINTYLRTPAKIKSGQAQLSDFVPSVFQPDFTKSDKKK